MRAANGHRRERVPRRADATRMRCPGTDRGGGIGQRSCPPTRQQSSHYRISPHPHFEKNRREERCGTHSHRADPTEGKVMHQRRKKMTTSWRVWLWASMALLFLGVSAQAQQAGMT